MSNKLNIVSVDNPEEKRSSSMRVSPKARRAEAEAKFERLWLQNPEQFNPNRDAINRIRIDRTWKLITAEMELNEKKAVDLGCGYGFLTTKMREAGADVDAVDIASIALKRLEQNDDHIRLIQDWVPQTKLEDSAYDLVVCTELIAELQSHDYRLFFSELCRLVKNDGIVICSTALDINSEDALQRFEQLAETEFLVKEWTFSYHRLYIRLCHFFESPNFYYECSRSKTSYEENLSGKRGLSRLWFNLNSSYLLGSFWGLLSYIANPLHRSLLQADGLAIRLEAISKFIWDIDGISHAIFVGQKKPLIITEPSPILGKERIRKWE